MSNKEQNLTMIGYNCKGLSKRYITCAFKGCGYDLITKQILQICDEVNER